ncbi:MAG: thiamine pyrophosphate-dependent enzyme [Candidatus Lernaella stagnicola]|nr:thiamine pyrophosphate-dependent enzyme [Candidatus Lernaella stagnicola]
MEPLMLTGNEAVARAVVDSGTRVAASYPGSPTVQILEAVATYDGLHAEWSTSEKVACEVAIGASMAGAAAFAAMKHVGINIAADPLMTFTWTKLNGPLVIAVGDDPGQISSQNEQDSRMWAEYAMIPMLHPATPQECYDMSRLAFDVSERFHTPVFVRLTDRTCHMMGEVVPRESVERPPRGFEPDPVRYYQVPPYSREARAMVEQRIPEVAKWVEDGHGWRSEVRDGRVGVVTFGPQYYMIRELLPELSIFKLDFLWPLPLAALANFASQVERVIVVEELFPFVENKMKLAGIACEGKEHFLSYGEIDAQTVLRVFAGLGFGEEPIAAFTKPTDAPPRGAMFCPGCPHRPVMVLLRELGIFCHGDIGCYLMGSYPPFDVLKTSVSMAASLGIAQGMEKALAGTEHEIENMVSVIGDSTLCHSGLPSVINYAYNGHRSKMLILDNRSTSMTGLQDNPVTGITVRGEQKHGVDLAEVVKALGVTNVVKVNQYNLAECRKVFREKFLEEEGPLAVIVTGTCALKYRKKFNYYYVDPDVCIGCRTCVQVGCPPISMRQYAHQPEGELHSYIDRNRCVGCSVCYQVCPVNAIKRSKLDEIPDVPVPVGLSEGEES